MSFRTLDWLQRLWLQLEPSALATFVWHHSNASYWVLCCHAPLPGKLGILYLVALVFNNIFFCSVYYSYKELFIYNYSNNIQISFWYEGLQTIVLLYTCLKSKQPSYVILFIFNRNKSSGFFITWKIVHVLNTQWPSFMKWAYDMKQQYVNNTIC